MARYVSTMYCDDIRYEIGGKMTFVGVYGQSLMVPEFPCTIPKLCLHLKAVANANDPFKSVRVVVYKDQEIIGEASVADSDLSATPPEVAENEDVVLKQAIGLTFVFTPLMLDQACNLRVRVYDEGREELRGSGLKIMVAPSGTVFPPN